MQQRGRQLGAGAAERVAEGDRAAVDVQPIRIDRKLAKAGEHLGRERFVQLDEIDLVERQAGDLQDLADRGNRPRSESAPARPRPSRTPRTGERRQTRARRAGRM
jgi:hypothetical protein